MRITDYFIYPINKVFEISYNCYKRFQLAKLRSKLGYIGTSSEIVWPTSATSPENVYIGNNVSILQNSRLDVYPDKGENGNIRIGDNTYICYNFTAMGENIDIGKDVIIASDVMICSHNHGMNPKSSLSYSN